MFGKMIYDIHQNIPKQRMQFVFGNTSTASSCAADHLLINGKRCSRMQEMHQKEGKKAFLHNSCKAKLGIWNPSQPCNLSNKQSKKHCQKLNRLKDSRSRLNFSSKIWIKCQLQNLDQTFASMSWLNFSFRIFTIYWNLDQNLASKSWLKFTFGILTKLQYLYQASAFILAYQNYPSKIITWHWVTILVSQSHMIQVSKVLLSQSVS